MKRLVMHTVLVLTLLFTLGVLLESANAGSARAATVPAPSMHIPAFVPAHAHVIILKPIASYKPGTHPGVAPSKPGTLSKVTPLINPVGGNACWYASEFFSITMIQGTACYANAGRCRVGLSGARYVFTGNNTGYILEYVPNNGWYYVFFQSKWSSYDIGGYYWVSEVGIDPVNWSSAPTSC